MRRFLATSAFLAFPAVVACDAAGAAPDAAPAAVAESPAVAEANEREPKPAAAAKTPYTMTAVAPDDGELFAVLAGEVEKAKGKGQRAHVEFWADWCGPCKELEASLDDPRMTAALAGTYIIRMNSDDWGPKLEGSGFDISSIPAFFELGEAGKPTGRKITGAAWAENTAENMAPPLGAYFDAASAQEGDAAGG